MFSVRLFSVPSVLKPGSKCVLTQRPQSFLFDDDIGGLDTETTELMAQAAGFAVCGLWLTRRDADPPLPMAGGARYLALEVSGSL